MTKAASKVVFRIPPTANLAALLLAVTATPFAFAAPGLQLVYLVPMAMVVWVVRNRTTADATGLIARTTFSSKSLRWEEVVSLKLNGSKIAAVDKEGTETRLPGVRLRHLTLLSRISGGVVPDPAGRAAAADE